jgi:hypothetical protein
VASHLSLLTGETWLSLAGCGLNASQELLLFLTHQHRLGQLGHVVVLSGLNSLAHEALCEILASPNDPQHAKAHQAFLNSFNEGMQDTAPARRQSLWQRLARPWPRQAPQWPALDACRPGQTPGPRRRQHRPYLAPMGAPAGRRPYQPDLHPPAAAALVPGDLPAGEQAMLAALAQQPTNFDRLLGDSFDSQLHSAFFRRIRSQADPVPCYDMNCMLSSSPVLAQTCSSIACTSTIWATTPWPR